MADLDKTDPLASMLGDGYSKLDQTGKVAAAGSFLKSRDEADKTAKGEAGKRAEGQIISEFGPSLYSKPYEEFKPSQESMSGFAALGSLMMVAGTMMGSKGRLAGIGAMNNIAGMLKGYQSGRKDLYEQERQQFEENMKIQERNRADIKEAFNLALKMAPTNLRGAEDFLNKTFASKGMTMPQAMLKTSGVMHTIGTVNGALDRADDITKQIADSLGYKGVTSRKDLEARIAAQAAGTAAQSAAEEAARKKRLDESLIAERESAKKNPIKIQFEGKTVLADPVTMKPLRDDKGDVIEPGTAARTSATNQQIQRRLATATTQAVEAFKAITDMPPEATTGIIPFLGSKEGVISYIQSATGRALSSDEANVLNTYFKGVGRNLATIEASGVATGLVGLANSFESLAPMSGDSDYAVAAKLAEGRAVIENGIRVALTDLSVTDEQKALLEDNLKGIQEAIPYTRRDLNQALKAKSDTEGTLGTSTAGVAKPDANLPKPTTDAEFNALPKGSRYIDPDDGKIYVK